MILSQSSVSRRGGASPPLSNGSTGGTLADKEFPLHDAASCGDERRVRHFVEVRTPNPNPGR